MSTRSTRRAPVVGVAVALAAGVLLMPAPAHAGILDTPQLQSQLTFTNSGPATCTASGPGPTSQGPLAFAANGVPVTTTSTSSRTYTNNANALDVTTMTSTISSTITARTATAGDALSGFTFTSKSTLTATSNLGTAQQCGASAGAIGAAQFTLDLPAARVVTLDASGVGVFQVQLVRINPAPTPPNQLIAVQLASLGPNADTHATKLLPAGTYQAAVIEQAVNYAPTPGEPTTTRQGDVTVEASFALPGSATGAATGDGGKYLSLGEGRDCAAGSLTSTWKSKAGKGDKRKVKKAKFYVNGTKVATVKKPKKKQVTTLTGLPPGKAVDVEVRLKLAEKGAGTVTVERSYRFCS